jgi:hypothetical protein
MIVMINKNSIKKVVSDIEMLEFIFTHCKEFNVYDNDNMPHVSRKRYGYGKRRANNYVFSCPECKKYYDIDKLHYRHGKVMCECGAVYNVKDIQPLKQDFRRDNTRITDIIQHNKSNGTSNKLNVPTLIGERYFFCSKCHKTHNLNRLSNNNNKLVCTCGEEYEFKDVKILYSEMGYNYLSSDVYFDDNKISISVIAQGFGMTRDGKYYWNPSNIRLTMNLDTGYSYVTNKGDFYSEFNRIWQRSHNTKAPVMFNCTYSEIACNIDDFYINGHIAKLRNKYQDYPNLLKLMYKHNSKMKIFIQRKTNKVIDEYMTNYLNTKFNYEIRPLIEEHHDYEGASFGDFIIKNRFINLDYDYMESFNKFLREIKFTTDTKRFDYSVFKRETNLPFIDWINKNIKISKSLRKEITKEFSNEWKVDTYMRHLMDFICIAKRFKNKENINKLYKLIMSNNTRKLLNACYYSERCLNEWLNKRDEYYISNIKTYGELKDKFALIEDAIHMIYQIEEIYGEGWIAENVIFKNEQQYHDDIMEIRNSQAFLELQEVKRKEELSKPFELEDETLALESNEITIARNRYELSTIGSAMHICVGSYGCSVENSNCRIAYIQENGEYKACLELRIETDSKTKETFFKLVQAKLKHNRYVGSEAKYNNIVYNWCQENSIEINTNDMQNKIIEGECVVYE